MLHPHSTPWWRRRYMYLLSSNVIECRHSPIHCDSVKYTKIRNMKKQKSTLLPRLVYGSTFPLISPLIISCLQSVVVCTGCPAKLFTLGYLLFCRLLVMQNAKVGTFFKNLGNLLHDRHKNFEIRFRNS